jgi:hypothetical protein
MKYLFAGELVYMISITIPKLSVCAFYYRVFNLKNKKVWRWLNYILAVLVASYVVGFIFHSFFKCRPISKNWIPTEPGTCDDMKADWLASATTSVILDFLLLIFPLPHLWTLQLPLRRKIALVGVFICGYWYVDQHIPRTAQN